MPTLSIAMCAFCFVLMVIPWENDGLFFIAEETSPGTNRTTGCRSSWFSWGQNSNLALWDPSWEVAGWPCLAVSHFSYRSFLSQNKKERPQIVSLPSPGGHWGASRGKQLLLSFHECSALCISFLLFNVSLPPAAWFGTTFSLGRALKPNPLWRSPAWRPLFISMPLGLRIYLWSQAWARFRIIQGFKSWGYEK